MMMFSPRLGIAGKSAAFYAPKFRRYERWSFRYGGGRRQLFASVIALASRLSSARRYYTSGTPQIGFGQQHYYCRGVSMAGMQQLRYWPQNRPTFSSMARSRLSPKLENDFLTLIMTTFITPRERQRGPPAATLLGASVCAATFISGASHSFLPFRRAR